MAQALYSTPFFNVYLYENLEKKIPGKRILYSLDSKPGGLLSKRGSRRRTCPLEIHYTQGDYFQGGLTFGRGLTIQTIQYYNNTFR